MPEYTCCVCHGPSTAVVVDGDFRVSVCDKHVGVTWAQWQAERRLTHPPRLARRG